MSTSYFSSKFPMEVAMAEHNQAAPMPGIHRPFTMKVQCQSVKFVTVIAALEQIFF
jgi:hypothetical protein